jgi:hypothetical protein
MSAAYPRNFTLSVSDRLRALAAGPPAFARRLRRIEELERAILLALRDAKSPLDPGALPEEIAASLARLNQLVDDHNRYYPIEAGLPIDVRTGGLLDWGEPWRPMPPFDGAALLARARARP